MPDLDWRCCVEWRWNRDRGGGSGERAGTGNLMRLKIPNAGSSEAVATEHVQGGVFTSTYRRRKELTTRDNIVVPIPVFLFLRKVYPAIACLIADAEIATFGLAITDARDSKFKPDGRNLVPSQYHLASP